MIEIHKSAWQHFRRNSGTMLGLAAMLYLLDIAKAKWDLSAGATIVPQLLVVMFLHQMVLYGEKLNMIGKPSRKLQIGPFLWASFMIMIFAGLATVLFLVLSGLSQQQMLRAWIIVFLVFYFIFMVLLGTSLPAAVASDRYNPKISLIRAKSTWAAIAGGFIVGPVATGAILLAAVVILLNTFGASLAGFPKLGGINILGLLVDFTWSVAGIFISLLGVVVLCRAYLRIAPPDVLAELELAKQTEA